MNYKKICITLILILSIICIHSSNVLAIIDFNGIYDGGSSVLNQPKEDILKMVRYAGGTCAVVMLVYMGIKFLLASPDGQADLKKELPLWVMGCLILFSPTCMDVIKTIRDLIRGNVASDRIESTIKDTGGLILGGFQAVGASIAVIILVYIGIKYMIESPDGKATLKKRLPTYLIGAALVFAAPQLASVMLNFATTL